MCTNHLYRLKTTLSLVAIVLLLSGCSWQEQFVIINNSDSDITVTYELKEVKSGFPIFEQIPTIYQINSSGSIDWNKNLSYKDHHTSPLIVKVTLPKKSALIFGHLSNDNYSKYDQYFINSRIFNLEKLDLKKDGQVTKITADTFDTFFEKTAGQVRYTVK